MKSSIKKGLVLVTITGALCIGGAMAYLTDYDDTVNEFIVGKIDVTLEEPHWKPKENLSIVPSQEVAKDPQIKNTGVNDAFVYLEVTVPIGNVTTADTNGNRIDKKETELFSFTPGNAWSLIGTVKKENNQVYTYAYHKILKPEETTTPLFEKVVFANIIEGQLDAQKLSVPVKAYAIQSTNTGGNEGTIVEQAKTAFQKYVNQNKV